MEKADCHTRHSLFSLCLQRDDDSSSSFCRPGLTRPRHKKIPERLFIGLIFLLCSSCEVDIFSVLLTSCSAARKPPPPRTHGSGDSISSEFPRSQPTDPSPPLHAKHRQKRGHMSGKSSGVLQYGISLELKSRVPDMLLSSPLLLHADTLCGDFQAFHRRNPTYFPIASLRQKINSFSRDAVGSAEDDQREREEALPTFVDREEEEYSLVLRDCEHYVLQGNLTLCGNLHVDGRLTIMPGLNGSEIFEGHRNQDYLISRCLLQSLPRTGSVRLDGGSLFVAGSVHVGGSVTATEVLLDSGAELLVGLRGSRESLRATVQTREGGREEEGEQQGLEEQRGEGEKETRERKKKRMTTTTTAGMEEREEKEKETKKKKRTGVGEREEKKEKNVEGDHEEDAEDFHSSQQSPLSFVSKEGRKMSPPPAAPPSSSSSFQRRMKTGAQEEKENKKERDEEAERRKTKGRGGSKHLIFVTRTYEPMHQWVGSAYARLQEAGVAFFDKHRKHPLSIEINCPVLDIDGIPFTEKGRRRNNTPSSSSSFSSSASSSPSQQRKGREDAKASKSPHKEREADQAKGQGQGGGGGGTRSYTGGPTARAGGGGGGVDGAGGGLEEDEADAADREELGWRDFHQQQSVGDLNVGRLRVSRSSHVLVYGNMKASVAELSESSYLNSLCGAFLSDLDSPGIIVRDSSIATFSGLGVNLFSNLYARGSSYFYLTGPAQIAFETQASASDVYFTSSLVTSLVVLDNLSEAVVGGSLEVLNVASLVEASELLVLGNFNSTALTLFDGSNARFGGETFDVGFLKLESNGFLYASPSQSAYIRNALKMTQSSTMILDQVSLLIVDGMIEVSNSDLQIKKGSLIAQSSIILNEASLQINGSLAASGKYFTSAPSSGKENDEDEEDRGLTQEELEKSDEDFVAEEEFGPPEGEQEGEWDEGEEEEESFTESRPRAGLDRTDDQDLEAGRQGRDHEEKDYRDPRLGEREKDEEEQKHLSSSSSLHPSTEARLVVDERTAAPLSKEVHQKGKKIKHEARLFSDESPEDKNHTEREGREKEKTQREFSSASSSSSSDMSREKSREPQTRDPGLHPQSSPSSLDFFAPFLKHHSSSSPHYRTISQQQSGAEEEEEENLHYRSQGEDQKRYPPRRSLSGHQAPSSTSRHGDSVSPGEQKSSPSFHEINGEGEAQHTKTPARGTPRSLSSESFSSSTPRDSKDALKKEQRGERDEQADHSQPVLEAVGTNTSGRRPLDPSPSSSDPPPPPSGVQTTQEEISLNDDMLNHAGKNSTRVRLPSLAAVRSSILVGGLVLLNNTFAQLSSRSKLTVLGKGGLRVAGGGSFQLFKGGILEVRQGDVNVDSVLSLLIHSHLEVHKGNVSCGDLYVRTGSILVGVQGDLLVEGGAEISDGSEVRFLRWITIKSEGLFVLNGSVLSGEAIGSTFGDIYCGAGSVIQTNGGEVISHGSIIIQDRCKVISDTYVLAKEGIISLENRGYLEARDTVLAPVGGIRRTIESEIKMPGDAARESNPLYRVKVEILQVSPPDHLKEFFPLYNSAISEELTEEVKAYLRDNESTEDEKARRRKSQWQLTKPNTRLGEQSISEELLKQANIRREKAFGKH